MTEPVEPTITFLPTLTLLGIPEWQLLLIVITAIAGALFGAWL